MATLNTKLAKTYRLFIGNTASPANDTTYTAVTNENEIELKYSVDTEEVVTKEGGKVTVDGVESYELSFTASHVFADTGMTTLRAARNKAWKYQIRDCSASPAKVWVEGTFLLSELSDKIGASGAIETTGTLKNAGDVTENATPRTLTSS